MQQNISQKNVRLNIQIPFELKNKLSRISALEGKKVSALVRESIEVKIEQIEKKIFEEKMKRAYIDLAQENKEISQDFKYVDAENL
ncbi:MAG: hypothetical protein V3S16_16435 [Candidatus Desulfatibia sp.]|uniref:hypothetical protein n=1 Tax=Candidatus Desulfatibia sp. TaxID=3101189 RepID=UPI002F2BFD69